MWKEDEKKPIGEYLAWAYGIAWISELLILGGDKLGLLDSTVGKIIMYLVLAASAGLAPTYAACIVAIRHGKATSVINFCKQAFKVVDRKRTIITVIVTYAILLIMNMAYETYLNNQWFLFIVLIPVMIAGGGMEETGWRGLLQPALEEKMHFVLATLVTGVIWAGWHLPLFLISNTSQSHMSFLSFLFYCITLSFVLANVYRISQNICSCILVHAWANVVQGMFTRTAVEQVLSTKVVMVFAIVILLSITIRAIGDMRTARVKAV
jgi:membrane protease YdiL (CAAX protease family)